MSEKVYINAMMDSAELVPLAGGSAAVFTTRCPSSSNGVPNEDSAAIFPVGKNAAVLVVADGAGGGKMGDKASGIAIDAMRESLKGAQADDKIRNRILNGFEVANEQVLGLGVGAGTTLAVVEIRDGMIRSYHVGDSQILVVGQKGKVKLQTIPHSPTGYGVEAGMIDQDEAIHHDDRHYVSNLIGDSNMRIDIASPVELSARDTVILASDGLCDNLLPDEIVECVRKGPLEESASALATTTLMRMQEPQQELPAKPDDLTIVLFRQD